jgi:hypothetical protein
MRTDMGFNLTPDQLCTAFWDRVISILQKSKITFRKTEITRSQKAVQYCFNALCVVSIYYQHNTVWFSNEDGILIKYVTENSFIYSNIKKSTSLFIDKTFLFGKILKQFLYSLKMFCQNLQHFKLIILRASIQSKISFEENRMKWFSKLYFNYIGYVNNNLWQNNC